MFFRRRAQKDFDAEIEAHIALETERLRSQGISPEKAQAAARRAFGNRFAAQERFYETKHAPWLDHLKQDLLYAFRTLRKSPTFTAAAVLTLALGIGANTALFTIIDGVLLRPLPYPEPERIAMLYQAEKADTKSSLAPADFLEYRAQVHGFQTLAAYRETVLNITGIDRPERITGAVVTPDFFAVLRVQAELGRTLVAGLDQPGAERPIVLSHSLWQRHYGSDPNILSRRVDIDGEPRTVVGVMPPSFRFPDQSEAWALARYAVPEHPLRPQIDQSSLRDTHYFDVIGRLTPGASLAQVQAEADTVGQRLKQEFGKDEEGDRAAVIPLHDDLVGGARGALLILLGAVTLLLLIACVNVANILLARGASRQKEMAIRGALGASKGRIVRQLLTESLLVAAAGGLLGALLAYGVLAPLRALIPGDILPPGTALELDLRVLAFTAVASLGAGIFFGLFPALQLAKSDINVTLKEGGRSSTGDRRSQRTRSVLVVSEIALATVLLIGAGLLIRSFSSVLAAPGGFNPERVLTLQTWLSPTRYATAARRLQFVNQALDRIRALPGVGSASVISRLPLNAGRSTRSFEIKGLVNPAEGDADYLVISPGYFTSMGIRLIRGRVFTERDNNVMIVNESAVRRFWPNQEPIGQFVRFEDGDAWMQVVGVVEDVRQHQLDRSSPKAVYVPFASDPWPFMAFVVRMKLESSGAAANLEAAIHSVDRDQPVYNLRPMREVVSGSLSSRRFRMLVLALFASLALALACVGIYGVMAYSVSQRASEIGIRMAFGADRKAVLALVLAQGFKLALAGVLLGAVLSLGLSRFLVSALYGVQSTDGVTFASSSLVLIAVAILASYLPAWRAAKVDPATALRSE